MAKFTTDWIQSAIRDGRGFVMNIGAFSTPIVGGGAGTVLDADQPEGCISIPTNTTIIPIFAKIQCHVPLIAADSNESEILLAADIAAANAGDGTATAETPVNMRPKYSRTSLCTCTSAYTANTTAPTLGLEIDRAVATADVQGTAANALWGMLALDYNPKTGFYQLDGPSALYVYWGGTVATSGFGQVGWLEFPTAYFA